MFYRNISVCNFDFIALSETWLFESISSNELFTQDYVVFRKDRNYNVLNASMGGGVLFAAKNVHTCVQVNLSSITDTLPTIDIICVTISSTYKSFFYVLVIYIPPSTSYEDYELLLDLLSSLEEFHNNKVFIVGDFNIPQFSANSNDRFSSLLNNFASFLNLSQFNHILNILNRTLDLIFTNSTVLVYKSHNPLVAEDRYNPALEIQYQIEVKPVNNFQMNPNSKQFNFKKADFLYLYNTLLSTDWSAIYNSNMVNDACITFYDILSI